MNSPFSKDYSAARARFLAAAEAAGSKLDSHRYPANGPNKEALFTDVAWLGPRDAKKVFVTVSATHGVEGFYGSAAQIDWLETKTAKDLPDDVAAMFVHAINPYGFAWSRRVTHENVDLNRNWVDFGAPLPVNERYRDIAHLLTPSEWTTDAMRRTLGALDAYAKKLGSQKDFVQAVSGGQFSHRYGLFYGGLAPTFAHTCLKTLFEQRLASAEHVGIIDFHSGLGDPGIGEMIVMAAPGQPMYERATEWWGKWVKSETTGQSVAAKIAGGWPEVVPDFLPHAQVTAAALEVGTVDVMTVLIALLADAWLHTYGSSSARAEAIRLQMRNAFYTDTDDWRGKVLGQARVACRLAVAGLRDS